MLSQTLWTDEACFNYDAKLNGKEICRVFLNVHPCKYALFTPDVDTKAI